MKTLKWSACTNNTQELKVDVKEIEIEIVKGKWIEPSSIDQDENGKISKGKDSVYPIINFTRKMNFENPNKEEFVYYLNTHEDNEKGIGVFIKLDYWQNQQFLWEQRSHWLQEKDIYKFVIPTLISMFSLFIAYLAYIKQ
jgi:hypothetical protein